MPKGIFERSELHKERSRQNGKKVKGLKPVNAKIDIGYRVGDLIVKERLTEIGIKPAKWICECVCGNLIERTANQISRRDGVRNCGCKKNPRPNNFKGYEQITGTYWARIQKQAKDRNYVFEITMQDVWNLYIKQNKKCALSGLEIDFHNRTASIDRINNSIGYKTSNIQIVHKDINHMKANFMQDYFINLCKKIIQNNS